MRNDQHEECELPIFKGSEYSAFLFDMDGTMLDSSVVVERVWREWAGRWGIDQDAVVAACHGVQGPDIIRRFGPSDIDVSEEARWLMTAEMADVEGIVPIDGIVDFVERLDPSDWAIVTSAPRDLAELRLKAVGLPRPEVMVTAEDVAKGKPDPEGYLKAARTLGVPILDCLIFEDSTAGISAGEASGARVVIVGDRAGGTGAGDSVTIADYL